MNSPRLTPDQLAGVYEKLKRANETIGNLKSEITIFLNKRPEGGFSKDEHEAAKEFAEFHAKREIPLRFGVIAGEVAHHLRSSLDHIAWMLSSESYRRDRETAIAFPIFLSKPAKKDEITSYSRKIEGIQSVVARDLIERLQPYNAANPAGDPLTILHELDREDKHHTLILIQTKWNMIMTVPIRAQLVMPITFLDTNEELFPSKAADKAKLEFAPQIAFAQLAGGKSEAVIPTLTELANKLGIIVQRFAEL
jgi:hypothetical protein